MGTRQARAHYSHLEEVRRRFERWRRTRKVLSRIPEPLWAAAVEAAGAAGISHTAKTLRVNQHMLKKRIAEAAATPVHPDGGPVATFFSNLPLRRGLALANARWSWKMAPARRCGSISKALRHPTWQR